MAKLTREQIEAMPKPLQLAGANLHKANLHDTNLSGADVSGTDPYMRLI